MVINQYWQEKYRRESGKSWNLFYRRNQTRFFKDRHWTHREFPLLLTCDSVFEIGCGVGNFILPLLHEERKDDRNFKAFSCDFSCEAIKLLDADKRKDSRLITFVADIAHPGCFSGRGIFGVHVISTIFVLSALPPESLSVAIKNIISVMYERTLWIIRDYAQGDAAQEKFHVDRKLEDNLFVRQDGTLAAFFELNAFKKILEEHGLQITESSYIDSKTVNIAKNLEEARRFIQVVARIKN